MQPCTILPMAITVTPKRSLYSTIPGNSAWLTSSGAAPCRPVPLERTACGLSLYRGHPEGLLGRARETRSPRQSEGRGGPFPSPPPGQTYPSPSGGEDLLPRVFELREEAEAVPLGAVAPTSPHPGPQGLSLFFALLPALAARGHQGAFAIRPWTAPRVPAALSQDFSCRFATSPPRAHGGG